MSANSSRPLTPTLWGRWVDLVLLGGASMIAFVAALLFPDTFRQIGSRPDQMLLLNAVVSYPHIMASFLLFYGKGGNSVTHPRIAWIAPIFLAALLVYCVQAESVRPLLFLAQVGFLYFFWHFLMQGVGCSLWLLGPHVEAAMRMNFRRMTFGTALVISLTGWLSLHKAGATENVFALPLPHLPIPEAWGNPIIWVSILAPLIYFGYLMTLASKLRLSGIIGAALPVLSLSLWFSPLLVGSPFRVLVQFLHGLQFFAFFWKTQVVHSPRPNSQALTAWLGCALVGVALFAWVPERMELAFGGAPSGPTGRIVAAFAIFLNIHHYLVDGTLWRLSEARNRQRLGLGMKL